MAFQYKMLQIPPQINISSRDARGQEAATYLESIVAKNATQGWEFYRVDSIGVEESPGCIASIFGAKTVAYIHYVVTFRKEA